MIYLPSRCEEMIRGLDSALHSGQPLRTVCALLVRLPDFSPTLICPFPGLTAIISRIALGEFSVYQNHWDLSIRGCVLSRFLIECNKYRKSKLTFCQWKSPIKIEHWINAVDSSLIIKLLNLSVTVTWIFYTKNYRILAIVTGIQANHILKLSLLRNT